MTFDEWFQSKQGEPYDSMYPFARDAYAAGKLEAAQHTLDMWKEQMAHETSFQTRLLAYVEELK